MQFTVCEVQNKFKQFTVCKVWDQFEQFKIKIKSLRQVQAIYGV